MPDVKDLIRDLRKELELSQAKVAARSGGDLTRDDMSKLEVGRNKASSHGMRHALARAFGLSVPELDRYLDGGISLEEVMRLVRPHVAVSSPTPRRRRSRALRAAPAA